MFIFFLFRFVVFYVSLLYNKIDRIRFLIRKGVVDLINSLLWEIDMIVGNKIYVNLGEYIVFFID